MKFALALGFVVTAATGCPGTVDPDGGPGPDPIIAFSTPRDGFVLNNADDTDGDPENGIQLDVRVRYSGAEGTTLTLSSDQGESATADTEAGFATFTAFTIDSSAEGLVNVLTATDGDVSESISVTGRYNLLPPPECTFIVPTNGANLSVADDANSAEDGFQFAVRISCVGTHVEPGHTVEISAGGAVVERALDASLEVNTLVTAGTVPGLNTVTATLSDGDEILDEVSITVTVVDAANSCTITSPANDAVLTVDADPATGGFQIDVALECEGPNVFAGQTVSVNAGAAPATTSLTGATAPFTAGARVTAAGSGANTITATLQGAIASAAIVVTVGVEAPFCEFVSPGPAAPVNADLDENTAGIQFEALVHCGDLDAGTSVTVTGGSADVSGALDAGGDVTLVVTVADEGEYTLTATAPGADPVDTTFTVAILTLCDATITAPADGSVFDASAVDADLNTPEFDISVELSSDPACVGAIARVSNSADIFEATVAADGTATVLVTLADGVHALVAEIETTDGIGATDSISVTVDRNPAGIVVTSPAEGSVYGPADDLDGNPANGISIPLSGTITGATTASYVLACGGNEVSSGPLTLDVDGNFASTFADLAVNACELSVTASDGVNDATLVVNFTIANVSVDVTLGDGVDLAPTGFFIAGEDKNPGTAATMEIDLDVTATFDTGTYTAAFEVVRTSDNVVVQSGSLGALTSGVVATAELALPYGESTAYRVDVTLTPGAGPVVVASETFVVDTVTPTLTWQTPTEGFVYRASNDQSPNAGFQGIFSLTTTGHVGGVVNLAFTGAATVDATCIAGANNICINNGVTLVDGAYSVTASATDPAGNIAIPAVVGSFSVDATLPLVDSVRVVNDTVDAAGNAGPDGQLNRAENGGLSAPATSSVVVTFAVGASIESGRNVTLTVAPGTSYVAQSNGTSVTFASAVLAEGNLSFTVSGTDAALNPTSGANQPFAFRVDTTPPSIGIVGPPGTTINQSPVSIAVSTNAENGTIVTLTDVTGGGSIVLGTATVVAGGATFSGIVLEQGSRTLRASVSDLAGNVAFGERTYLVDTIAPELTLSLTSDPAVDLDLVAPGWQVQFSVAHTGLETGRTIRLISNLTGQRGSAPADVSGTATIVGTFNTSAVHQMTAQATDAGGSTGVSNAVAVDIVTGEYDVFIDSPDPSTGELIFGALDVTAGLARVVITVPGLGLATVTTVRINGVVDPTAVVTRTGDTLTISRAVTEGESGTIEVSVDDTVMTGTTGIYPYSVDALPPTVAWAASTPTVFNIASDDAPSVAGLQTTVQIEVTECENGTLEILEGALGLGSVQVGPSGAGTIAVEVIDTVEHVNATWTARCIDMAGNEGSDDHVNTVDLTAPAIGPITTSIIDVRRGQIRVEFAAPGDDGSTGAPVSIQVVASRDAITAGNFDAVAALPKFPGTGGLLDESVSTPAGTTFTAQTEFLAFDNTWNLAVRATDAVGNSAFATVSEGGLVTDVWSFTNVENDIGAGATIDDRSGNFSTRGGDFNGDDFDDLAIASYFEGDTCDGALCQGNVRLFAGGDDLTALALTRTISPAGYVGFGFRSTVADFDGDGFDDLIVAGVSRTIVPATNTRVIFVYYGTDELDVDGNPLLVNEFGSVVMPGAFTETRVIGDINGDGFVDIGVGASTGTTYYALLGGTTRLGNEQALAASAHVIFDGSTLALGDVGVSAVRLGNLDGSAGLEEDFVLRTTGQRLLLVRGSTTWPVPPATFDLSTIPSDDRLVCPAATCGREVSVGDLNGDGRVDLVAMGTNEVRVYLATATTLPTAASYRIVPAQPTLFDRQGTLAVGDVNGDGFDDVTVLLNADSSNPTRASLFMGAVYLEGSGLTSGVRSLADVLYSLDFTAARPGRVGMCGDLDDDGLSEICFGSEQNNVASVVRY
jgi:hypothetical protein